MAATTARSLADGVTFFRRIGPGLTPGLLTGIAVAALLILTGGRPAGALSIGFSCGLAIVALARPAPVYVALVFACLIASVNLGALPVSTDEAGFHVFSNWWKLLSPEGERHYGFLLINSLEIVMLGIAAGAGVRIARGRERLAAAGDLWPVVLFAAGVTGMLIYGLATGGATKPALWQVRPFFHLVVLTILTPQVLRTHEQLRATVWAVAIAVSLKALQTVWIFVVHLGARFGDWREIVSHEASIFFVGAIAFAVALLLYRTGSRQRIFLLCALPLLLLALVLNLRRTGYVALAMSLAMVPVLLHGRRRAALKLAIPLAALLAVYAAAFWNLGDHPLGRPVAKARSVVTTEAGTHDGSSNLYRLGENYNLRRTIADHPLGLGFGHPFELHTELPALDPSFTYWDYHPHNQILGLWMSLGPLGFAFFLTFAAGAMMLAGHELRRQSDPYLKAVSFFVLASVASSVLATAVDMFLWTERGAIFTAVAMGLLLALREMTAGDGALGEAS